MIKKYEDIFNNTLKETGLVNLIKTFNEEVKEEFTFKVNTSWNNYVTVSADNEQHAISIMNASIYDEDEKVGHAHLFDADVHNQLQDGFDIPPAVKWELCKDD